MDERIHFERNLLALSAVDPDLCKRLSSAVTTLERYRFLRAGNGAIVPAVVETDGSARPLHSMVDPEREALRLAATLKGGFLILFGLGGGFLAEAALRRDDIQRLLVVDFGIDGIAELLASKEYVSVFSDPRFRLLVDPSLDELRNAVHKRFQPALYGGISVLPLRSRVDSSPKEFSSASAGVKRIIDDISDDYSVQTYFGKRWFANIVRNILSADGPVLPSKPIRHAAVTAAGPSLDDQLPVIRERRSKFFLLATDTSLPALLDADLVPDAVISIDCQHISYFHFMRGMPENVPLYLDLASPPVVASRTRFPRFFSGGHPLTVYVSRTWRSLPQVDTSGGNVTYAAVALANRLGAERIELFGADFSYPRGASYARGTYIHPFFRRTQTRLAPLESRFSSFVFRNETLEKRTGPNGWRYETKPLFAYRTRLEQLAEQIDAQIVPWEGGGVPIDVPRKDGKRSDLISLVGAGAAGSGAREFLSRYTSAVERLPLPSASTNEYFARLSQEERDVLTTLLPTAAAIRKKNTEMESGKLIEEVKAYCLSELRRAIKAPN